LKLDSCDFLALPSLPIKQKSLGGDLIVPRKGATSNRYQTLRIFKARFANVFNNPLDGTWDWKERDLELKKKYERTVESEGSYTEA
jgi:hypothetical protein